MANDLTINNSLKVPGGLNVEGPLNFLPKGTIVAFNGNTAPTGWAICDGKTVKGYKTPDLRGRFIRMTGSGHSFGNKGGADYHTLASNELPSHSHDINLNTEKGEKNWRISVSYNFIQV